MSGGGAHVVGPGGKGEWMNWMEVMYCIKEGLQRSVAVWGFCPKAERAEMGLGLTGL